MKEKNVFFFLWVYNKGFYVRVATLIQRKGAHSTTAQGCFFLLLPSACVYVYWNVRIWCVSDSDSELMFSMCLQYSIKYYYCNPVTVSLNPTHTLCESLLFSLYLSVVNCTILWSTSWYCCLLYTTTSSSSSISISMSYETVGLFFYFFSYSFYFSLTIRLGMCVCMCLKIIMRLCVRACLCLMSRAQ